MENDPVPENLQDDASLRARRAARASDNVPAVGELLAQRYRVLKEIGKGGAGSVYLVEHVFLRKKFALKTLNTSSMSPTSWKRFEKEAHAASAFDHPGLVKVHDFGLIDENQPFLVMDFIDGETLADKIKASGALPLEVVIEIFSQAALAIGFAHEQGIVHRDIKPSNIMITQGASSPAQVKIVDFGIAKKVDDASLALTQSGDVFGTPSYMSPEQCMGLRADRRSDCYSLGCAMFECLTGSPPFVADNALSLMMKHNSEPPPTLSEGSLGKEFPDWLEQVMAKLLAKEPAERYGNLFAFANDLKQRGCQGTVDALSSQAAKPAKIRRMEKFAIPALVFCGMAVLLIATFLMGRASVAPPEQITSPPVLGPIVDFHKPPQKEGFYSSIVADNPHNRVFRFEPDFSIGRFIPLPQVRVYSVKNGAKLLLPTVHEKGGIYACGDFYMENFSAMGFELSAESTPDALDGFRDDEISVLTLREIDELTPAAIKKLARFTYLNALSMPETTLTRNHTDALKYLTHLEHLTLSGNRLQFDDLAGAAADRVIALNSLTLCGMKGDPTRLFKILQKSKTIRFLDLRSTSIQDKDLELIAKTPISFLSLKSCRKITEKGLEYLAAAPQIETLFLGDPGVQDARLCGKILTRFPKLKKVVCPLNWQPCIPELKRLMPRVSFEFDPATTSPKF